MELRIHVQNLRLKYCLLHSSSVWAFQKSLVIVKLQNIRRKNMDPISGEDVKEIVCLLCHPAILSVWGNFSKMAGKEEKLHA